MEQDVMEQVPLFDLDLMPGAGRGRSSPLGFAESNGALDELFARFATYREGWRYDGMLRFISRFPDYSAFNLGLVYLQNPDVSFVAPATRWQQDFGRQVKPDARPLVVLVPFGPIGFVYDVTDTEGPELPSPEAHPAAEGLLEPGVMDLTITNCRSDGVVVERAPLPYDMAGDSLLLTPEVRIEYSCDEPGDYLIQLNARFTEANQYAALVHELGHLYCGHLGASANSWWPARDGLSIEAEELEAETVASLVCRRKGLEPHAEEYLTPYLTAGEVLPEFSLYTVLRVVDLLERMGKARLSKGKRGKRNADE